MPVAPNFSHAMLREIYEQPDAIQMTSDQYAPGGLHTEAIFEPVTRLFGKRESLVIAASGSSRHAGLAGEVMIEDLAGLPVDVEYASEYSYRSSYPLLDPGVLVISQSGETADTLAALREARSRGLATAAITNRASSSMASEAELSLPTLAGREQAIPATKSFTTQLAVLYCLALHLARVRGRITAQAAEAYGRRLQEIPSLLKASLPRWQQQLEQLAPRLEASSTLLYLGRAVHYSIAREGALKVKESAYMTAEGYPAGELKHGPNALVSEDTPLIVIATVDRSDPNARMRYNKILQLIKTLRDQGARIIALATEGDCEISKYCEVCLFIPETIDLLSPILEVVPLQLLAYTLAVSRGIDVDRPRNLVKAVVSE